MRLTQVLPPPRIVALALLLAALGFGVESLRLGLWRNGMPGIGLTPMIAAAALFPVSVVMLFERQQVTDDDTRFQLSPFLGGAGFCLYCVGLTYLGLALPTFIAAVIWTRLLYHRPWNITLMTAAGVTLALYIIFVRLLGVPLPLFWT